MSRIDYFEDNEVRVEIISNSNNKNEQTLSYIWVPTQKRGKFLPQEAKKLGCHPKLHFKILANGEEVILPDGTVIQSDQVMEKPVPSESFIINFIPDESYIDSVVSNPKFIPYFLENIHKNTQLSLLYHSTQSWEIFKNEKYLEFMRKFGPNVNHVIDCKDLNTERITRFKAMILSRQYQNVCPRLYPLASLNLIDHRKNNLAKIEENLKEFKTTFAESGINIELYPPKSSGTFTHEVIKQSHLENEEEQKVIDKILDKNEEKKSSSEILKNFDIENIIPEKKFKNEPEILFCGTISMKPTSSRCASGIYVNIPGDKADWEESKNF